MHDNPAEDWRGLAERYRAMFDGELEELADGFADLTPTAQEVLRGEMTSRGLGDPRAEAAVTWPSAPVALARFASSVDPDADESSSESEGDAGGNEEDERPREFTWKTPLCACDSEGQAWEIHKALRRAGIDSWVERPGRDRVSSLRVVVAADQLEAARAIAAQPIPQAILDEYNEETPEFVAPQCPACGADDPVLESAEPTNAWLCEACGKQWSEPAAEEDGEQEKAGR